MTLQQEMPQFMGNAETCPLQPAIPVHQNTSPTARLVGQEHPFASVQVLSPDFLDIQSPGNLDDGNSSIKSTNQTMQTARKKLGIVNIA